MSGQLDVSADLLAGFLDEAPLFLTTLEDRLLAFEDEAQSGTIAIRDDGDKERMNEIFRAAHSLKGLAASLGFHRIRDVTHIMESIFDQLRNGKRELSASDVDALFSVVDVLRQLVKELTNPAERHIDIREHLDRLTAILERVPAAGAIPAPSAAPPAVTCDDSDLLARFVEAAVESLDEANEQLLKLERAPHDEETISAVFRCVHNIKGACGAVGCATLQAFTHDFETLLDRIRSGRTKVDSSLITTMLKALDQIRVDVAAISQRRYADVTGAGMQGVFDRWLNESTTPPASSPAPAALAQPTELAEGDATTILVTFPKGFADAPIQACILHNRLGDLGEIVASEPNVDALESSSIVERLSIQMRTDVAPGALERIIRAHAIESVTITPARPCESTSPVAPPLGETGANHVPAVNAMPDPVRPREGPKAGEPLRAAEATKAGETLRVDLERLDQLMDLGGELVIAKARFSQIQRRLRELLPRSNVVSLVEDTAERITRLRSEIERATACADSAALREAAEIANTLESNLGQVRSVLLGVHDSRGPMNEFSETLHGLNRIAESMQKRIMQTRMVSIGPLFQRFRRVVRDIAKATGKKVDLVLHGEQTELDKRMIDGLVDPLTHMVRNSVDHGIETPAERLAAGKPETATVTLTAFHRGRHICVQVKDDGRGVNVERVRRKIVERELATQAQVDAMSDQQATQFIFRPGFSTAEKVTDLSGRGMGMDIVRNKVEGVSGSVKLESVRGEGTIVTINLPLTMAIINAMVVRIGSGTYAIPLEAVVEVLTAPRDSVRHVNRRPVIRSRESVIPLGYLEQIFSTGLPEQRTACAVSDRLTVVILGFQNQRLGLIVDEMIGQEDIVIKDIASNFRNVQGVAGASIMGDGTVALILDVAAMMSGFVERSARESNWSDAHAQPAPATSQR